jgi:AraC-like DNA-binding protein
VTEEGDPFGAQDGIRGGLGSRQQKDISGYIAANIGSNIRADDLARVAHMSVGHFFRAFRESFGEPPLAYVAKQRIRRAQWLMLTSREPLSHIAFDCGMCDQAHFTRVFRRIVGISPGVWRRQIGTEWPSRVVVQQQRNDLGGRLCTESTFSAGAIGSE